MADIMACKVLENKPIAKDTLKMRMAFPAGGQRIHPGLFIHIRPFNRPDLILRRPISINSYDAANSTLGIVYQVKGAGTHSLATAQPGDVLDVYGPAGRAYFNLPQDMEHGWLIGGGIGCAPLKYVPEFYSDMTFSAMLGFRSADYVYQFEEFEELCQNVQLATDDGSCGKKTYVTELVRGQLQAGNRPDVILTCGPEPMLRALKAVLEEYDPDGRLLCLASLEQRMGCGMGACYTCTCAAGSGNARVCEDGPVFNIREVF